MAVARQISVEEKTASYIRARRRSADAEGIAAGSQCVMRGTSMTTGLRRLSLKTAVAFARICNGGPKVLIASADQRNALTFIHTFIDQDSEEMSRPNVQVRKERRSPGRRQTLPVGVGSHLGPRGLRQTPRNPFFRVLNRRAAQQLSAAWRPSTVAPCAPCTFQPRLRCKRQVVYKRQRIALGAEPKQKGRSPCGKRP